MLYVQLDTNWPDNEKVMDAGMDGAGLHAVTMCLAKRLESDGWVKRRILLRYGATDELIDRLVVLELLEADGVRVRPHDWLDRNPSQAAIAARREAKAAGGRRGNHSKWDHPGAYETCPKCQVIAPCEPDRSVSDPIPTKSEVTPEVATAIAPGYDLTPPGIPRIPEDHVQLAQDFITKIKQERTA